MYTMPEASKKSISEKQKASWSSGTRKATTHQDRSCARCGSTYTPGSASSKFCEGCRKAGPLIIQSRNGRKFCVICTRELDEKNRAADHCHVSGLMRGVLCNNCNVALGMLGDDPDVYMAAWAYIEQWKTLLETRTPSDLKHRLVYDPVLHQTWSDSTTIGD